MADSKYKLTYFTTSGRAEFIRYMFAYAGVEYEDNRITQDDWPNLKPTYHFGKLPVLEVDGQVIHQSVAIGRFLGKKFGLVNEDPVKDALLEALVDNLTDALAQIQAKFKPDDPEGMKVVDNILSDFLKFYENKAPDGYFYGSTPTWVDMYFTGITEMMQTHMGSVLEHFPNLTALTERIRNQEKIKKWIEVRPADMWKYPDNTKKT